MAKRIKNETPEPVYLSASPAFGSNGPAFDLLPGDLFRALQPTLKNDWLDWNLPEYGHYYIPAYILLDLARIWKDEPYFIHVELDLKLDYLVISSGQTPTGKFASRTTLKVTHSTEDDISEGRPFWSTCNDAFVPFDLNDGSERFEEFLRSHCKAPKVDPWIAKAASKDDARPALLYSWGDFATDGIRAHIDRSIPARDFADLGEYERPSESDIKHYRGSIERLLAQAYDNPTTLTIDAQALKRAVKLAKSTNKETIHLYANGRLDVWGTLEYEGDARVSLDESKGYAKSGPDSEIVINPRYLADALAGLSGEILISIPSFTEDEDGPRPEGAVYLTDGAREALIMPKRPE